MYRWINLSLKIYIAITRMDWVIFFIRHLLTYFYNIGKKKIVVDTSLMIHHLPMLSSYNYFATFQRCKIVISTCFIVSLSRLVADLSQWCVMLQSNLKLYVCCILFQFFLLFFCNTLIYKDIYPSSTVQSYVRQLILLITRTDGPNADCSVENMSPAMTLYNVPKKKEYFFLYAQGSVL